MGGGRKTRRRVKKDSRDYYIVNVGPKIINPYYSDKGSITEHHFTDFNKDIEVVLQKSNGEKRILNCVVTNYKAHSFNLYSDDEITFSVPDVKSGYVQTGLRYPNATNKSPYSIINMDGSVIEFIGDMPSFVGEYELIEVISNK